MVFHYHPRGFMPGSGSEDWLIYMGRDKYENEDLIKYGLPVDVWFHVDGLSSAHVYLRLPEGCRMEDIPAETLEDCAQLVKQNSIQGDDRVPGHVKHHRGINTAIVGWVSILMLMVLAECAILPSHDALRIVSSTTMCFNTSDSIRLQDQQRGHRLHALGQLEEDQRNGGWSG